MHTVLVVDDERVIRDGCTRFLGAEGYRVLTAANGQEAIDLLAIESVNVILCDLKMPVMGAIEVLEVVRVSFPGLPLIIITGHGTVANAVECMKLGAYDFITKPFRADHLSLVVARALEKQALEEKTRELQEAQARNLYDLATEQSRILTIVNCMADGVLVTNRDLEAVLCNPALTRLLEIPDNARQPLSLPHILAEGGLVEALKALLERAEGESEVVSRELTHGKAHLRATSAAIHGPDRQVLGTVTVFHDITRFKELDEMKSSFVHMVSHELRSPLAAIKQQQGVILEGLAGELTEKQRELLGRSQQKIGNLLGLINDLLDVAKIEAGHGAQQQVPLNLGDVLGETVTFLNGRAENQGVELVLEISAELPLVQADPRSMEEVFTNLISNAINYSPDGGTVTVSARPNGRHVEVRVSDTGIGIDPEELPKIFDKFYRVKSPKTRQVIGTGLGLAIVKGLLDSHRGSVDVESAPGVGTSFIVLLPCM
jgi:two-component system, OmpR family, phosphate regulon sensor histidine kinase PhoR